MEKSKSNLVIWAGIGILVVILAYAAYVKYGKHDTSSTPVTTNEVQKIK